MDFPPLKLCPRIFPKSKFIPELTLLSQANGYSLVSLFVVSQSKSQILKQRTNLKERSTFRNTIPKYKTGQPTANPKTPTSRALKLLKNLYDQCADKYDIRKSSVKITIIEKYLYV